MAEKVASYGISFTGDGSDIERLLSGIKTSVARDVAELQRITSKVELFKDIGNALPLVERALESAKQKVQQFTAEIAKIEATGAKAPKELTKSLAEAERAVASANRELNNQTVRLNELQGSLTRAGVNTKNLAAEQTRLAEASKVATAAAAEQAAKQALGLTTLKDVAPEIAKLRAAYETLRTSGKLSVNEVSAAQLQLNTRLAELTGTVTKAGQSFSLFGAAKSHVLGLVQPVFTVNEALNTVVGAFGAFSTAAREYRQTLAQVGAVTNLTRDELGGVGLEVRRLATDLGVDLNDAFKGLIALLRSGVPRENVVDVLRVSAQAAKAATVELGDGVKAADVLLSGFGVTVEELPLALDKVIQGAKSGGVNLTEFGNALGPLANIARASGVALDEVVATLAVMTSNGIDASNAATALGQIIQKLGSGEVRGKLRELNADGRGLVGTFDELGRQGRGLEDTLALGIGNPKTAAAVAALTNNSAQLRQKLDEVTTAAGATKKALDSLKDSPEEVQSKFNAALKETNVQLGLAVGSSSGYASVLTKILNGFNNLSPAMRDQLIATGELNKLFGASVGAAISMALGLDKVAESATKAVVPTRNIAAEITALTNKIGEQKKLIETGLTGLNERTAALQKAAQDEIAAITERVDAEIAQLDRSEKANVDNVKRIADINKTATAEKLDVAKRAEEEINRITREAIDARATLIREQGGADAEQKVQLARQQATITGNTQILSLYKAFYGDLKSQAQGFAQTLTKIEQERTAIAEGLDAKVRAARLAGLTDLQQYAAKVQEVDRLIAKGRETAATQGIDAAKRYFQQADQISESIKGEVLSDGQVVVTAFEAQQTQISKLKQSADAYASALNDAKDRAKEGSDATQKALDVVAKKIQEVTTQQQELQKEFGKGISIKVNEEIFGLQAAEEELNKLARERVAVIRVQTVNGGSAPTEVQGFNRGGPVGAQRFAAGGPVGASWTVPGYGNTDTYPAMLPVGSYVLRKAVAQKIRGFATGGLVGQTTGALELLGNLPDISPPPTASEAVEYARYVASFLRPNGVQHRMREQLGQYINALNRNPNDKTLLQALIRTARNAAANNALENLLNQSARGVGGGAIGGGTFGAFKNLPDWFDFEEQRKQGRNPARTRRPRTGFTTGGPVGTDSVLALLTPGERVIAPPVVRAYGTNYFDRLNRGIRPPEPLRFASGGQVPGAVMPARGTAGVGDVHIHVNIDAAGAGAEDPRVIDKITDAISQKMRRAGQRF